MSEFRRRLMMVGGGNSNIPNYLCFTALEDGTFSFTIGSGMNTDRYTYIEYSIDECNTWVRADNVNSQEITITTPTITAGKKIYWRGKGNQVSRYNTAGTYSYFSSTGKFNVKGDIYSLIKLDELTGSYTPTDNYFWGYVFQNTDVVDASLLLIGECYTKANVFAYLFNNCKYLIAVPELPTTLGTSCFDHMFAGCSSLVNTPSLPATVLKDGCYNGMFADCTSIVTAPTLPKVQYGNGNCYKEMFRGCTSLINAADITFTIKAYGSSCKSMYHGCTALVNPPALHVVDATGASCFDRMFYGCTSLVSTPVFEFTSIGESACYNMFMNCHSLSTAHKLLPTTLAATCYRSMFDRCHSLLSVPEDMLPATTLATGCYMGMFGNSGIQTAPKLPATVLVQNCYNGMFDLLYSTYKRLNYIKMFALDISASNCINNWVRSAPNNANCIIVKHIDAAWTTTGDSGVPSNWTIIYYDPTLDKYYTDQTKATECDDHGNPL